MDVKPYVRLASNLRRTYKPARCNKFANDRTKICYSQSIECIAKRNTDYNTSNLETEND
jgi:hypothetical protein